MSAQHAYAYLTQPEVRFLDAAVARLIPADDLGPGAKEADVTLFIDRQLTSTWGVHGRNYRQGPWREGTPQQGFQSRLTPQEIYRAGVVAPAGTPASAIQRLHDAFAAATNTPDIRTKLEQFSQVPVGNTPREFEAFLESNRARLVKVVREANIKVE